MCVKLCDKYIADDGDDEEGNCGGDDDDMVYATLQEVDRQHTVLCCETKFA